MKPLLLLNHVTKEYHAGESVIKALDDISLAIYPGEFAAVIGSSGSGKSTMMNILGCLDLPDQGEYWLDGVLVGSLRDRELSRIRNRKIGFIFQNFNLIPGLTALENVELQLSYGKMDRGKRTALAIQALEQVGLTDRLNHRPGQMSGGQQQRVAIARAIASSPEIILADEPTGNLDSHSTQEILSILQELHREGRTILLITHDSSVAERAERVIRIADGKVLCDRPFFS